MFFHTYIYISPFTDYLWHNGLKFSHFPFQNNEFVAPLLILFLNHCSLPPPLLNSFRHPFHLKILSRLTPYSGRPSVSLSRLQASPAPVSDTCLSLPSSPPLLIKRHLLLYLPFFPYFPSSISILSSYHFTSQSHKNYYKL